MLDRNQVQNIAVDIDGIYCDMSWWGGDGKPAKKKAPQYCKHCGHRLAECNNSSECLRKCKPAKLEWAKPKPGTVEKVKETGNPATYHGRPCRSCGGTERYIRGSACRVCKSKFGKRLYRERKGK
jgi:hypothetical protein